MEMFTVGSNMFLIWVLDLGIIEKISWECLSIDNGDIYETPALMWQWISWASGDKVEK